MSDVTVAPLDQIEEGTMRVVEAGGRKITVTKIGGELRAFDDTCTHQGCSLADGEIDGSSVVCPCHGSVFDVTTGAVLNPPATEPIAVYPVRVEDGSIKVEIP